ncbi:hypothetical protein Tco_1240117, partial [Tanacetum coccineum]
IDKSLMDELKDVKRVLNLLKFAHWPRSYRVNPSKVENVPLKEEEHTNWLEFKKLTQGKICITQSMPANKDEKKKARLCKSGSAELKENSLFHLCSHAF